MHSGVGGGTGFFGGFAVKKSTRANPTAVMNVNVPHAYAKSMGLRLGVQGALEALVTHKEQEDTTISGKV